MKKLLTVKNLVMVLSLLLNLLQNSGMINTAMPADAAPAAATAK